MDYLTLVVVGDIAIDSSDMQVEPQEVADDHQIHHTGAIYGGFLEMPRSSM